MPCRPVKICRNFSLMSVASQSAFRFLFSNFILKTTVGAVKYGGALFTEKQQARGLIRAPQTVGKPMRTTLDMQGGAVEGGGEPPFTFNPLELSSQVQHQLEHDFKGRTKAEALSGTKVKLTFNKADLLITDVCQIKAFGEILTD